MGVGEKFAALLLLLLPLCGAQNRCAYFRAVPREPTPDYPEQDFTGVTWSDRPLLPPPAREQDDMCMEDYTPDMAGQQIHIEEEIDGDIIIAKINYDGDGTPTIGSFLSGARVQLGAVIRREADLDNAWYLVITERQDYETPSMRLYMFNVDIWETDSSVLRILVSLNIENIDDNPPVIQLVNDCSVEELGEPRATECVYQVTDLDGAISIVPMYFVIEGSREEDQLFSFDELRYDNDQYTMTITLRINEALDFAARALHIFTVTAYDSLPNTHTVTLLVQVVNVEHRPPRWVEIWAMQQFDEKTTQIFHVSAIDGDTGIVKQILYRLNKDESYVFFDIDSVSGEFTVLPIDRDALEQEVFQLKIVAYKFDNESFSVESNVVIIVDDINDQIPTPLVEEYEISILEETPMSLSFENFGFHDRDLGENAQYNVYLESVSPPGAAAAFLVSPTQGYQRQLFYMSVFQHSLLDFEVPEYQNIVLNLVAVEINEPSHVGVATVRVHLINWNDEVPVFGQEVYEAEFEETVGAGFPVATVRADDRDVDDRVVHSLLGNAVNYLNIDADTGEITVAVDDAFDFLRQDEIYVQVRADDTLGSGPYNTATATLHIKLIDVNNNPPQLRLPANPPMVEENVPDGYVITTEIYGTDPDSTAEVYFEIEWESTYATKQGRQVDPVEYVGCVEIITVYPDETARGEAYGTIVVREIRDGVTIDFEEFEVLYLTIRVVDRNQVIGEDSTASTFTIIIEDMNDNWPVWSQSTVDTAFAVREVSLEGVVIGSVHATDIDGPIYNQIRYSIVPRDDTLADLVRIDALMGQIEVMTSGAIDADVPPRESLDYTVVASDCCTQDCPPPDTTCWTMYADITIRIIDTNNKIPEALEDEFDAVVYIFENATSGDEVLQLFARDLDRDEIYRKVAYQINYAVNPGLRDFFAVDLETGLISVEYMSDRVLDRDRGEPTHQIFVGIIDNFYSEGDGNRNQPAEINVTVVLLDVNDNAPELPPPSELFWRISEGLTEGAVLTPDIYAPDIDEPDTDNSRVNYDILGLEIQNRDIVHPDLFGMINVDNVTGELYCLQDLRGYWGTYEIHILAHDHGIPRQSSEEKYELTIQPYNFHAPEFTFPATPGTTVRLSRELASVTWPLTQVNGELLDRIEATDEDGLEAGTVTFEVTGDASAVEYFVMDNDGQNSGALRLSQALPEDINDFTVTITASDQGADPGPLSTATSIRVVFVATQGEPLFLENTVTAAFYELEDGLEESQMLTAAVDPKNEYCVDDCYSIYYYIYDGNSAGHFVLDSESNTLRVANALNRSEAEFHELVIGASNSATQPAIRPGPESLLTVHVTVREANPQPRFQQYLYSAGISVYDTINRELLTVSAVHSEGDVMVYTIDRESMTVDSSLEAVRDSAFDLHPQTGVLALNMQPTASMHGMFEFDVIATDTAGATDRTEVKIYLISSMNRVFFTFVNTLTQIEEHKNFIAQTLSVGFEMTCHVDQIVPASDENGLALDDITEVRTHFIENDIPVDVEVIELKRQDTALLRQIQTTLSTELIIMQDFVTGSPSEAGGGAAESVVQNILAGVTVMLAIMVAVLLLAYIHKTRTLNRRLAAMSTKVDDQLESKEPGFIPGRVVVPNTNKHAMIGSNPIWNEQTNAPDFDAISEVSYGSDLIGIEDNPQFSYDYFPPTPGAGGDQGGGMSGSNQQNFPHNFNTSSFGSQFANSTKKY